jgi:predicted permease
MGVATGVVLPCLLFALAGWLARRELRQYQASNAADGDGDGDDLFVYSRARLRRRMIGLGALAAIGVTLAVMELGASSAEIVTVCGALLATALLVLLVVPILDLRETARTARPGKGVKAR